MLSPRDIPPESDIKPGYKYPCHYTPNRPHPPNCHSISHLYLITVTDTLDPVKLPLTPTETRTPRLYHQHEAQTGLSEGGPLPPQSPPISKLRPVRVRQEPAPGLPGPLLRQLRRLLPLFQHRHVQCALHRRPSL